MSSERAMQVFLEAFDGMPRLGPGQEAATHRAYRSLTLAAKPRILDLGCGNGRQTLDLAEVASGPITAVDNHAPFLERLREEANAQGVDERVRRICMDMAALDFPHETFDLIWSEAAIYNIGFAKGLAAWKSLLAPGGQIAVSEACWLRPDPPPEIERWWRQEYPAITDVETNLALIQEAGYEPLEHFTLPPEAWNDEYYGPLQPRIEQLRAKYAHEPEASSVLDMMQLEIDQYNKYGDSYGYVFFLMRLT
ncbi:MAG: class I SAM-dependent methyltransferase [Nannocystaceae bacterium]